MKVLLVSNDTNTRVVIDKTLTYNGFIVHSTIDSTFAWKYLQEIRFDFVIVDMQLKHESGLSFYKSLRQIENNIPVIMIGEGALDKFILTDLSETNYDYMMKPLKFVDLRDKINQFLDKNSVDEKLLQFGDFKIDYRQQLLIFKDKLLQLSKMELDILILLAQRNGEIIHPKKIANLLRKEGKFVSMSIFFYVSKLRQKLQKYGDDAFDISFIKDQGYQLSFH